MKQIHLNEEQKQDIIRMYTNGYSTKEISQKYDNRNYKSIITLLNIRNIPIKTLSESHRIYPVKEDFFDDINNEKSAYTLGLLYADGYNNTDMNAVSLILQNKDVDILYKLTQLIQPTKPIKFYKTKEDKWQNAAAFRIHNEYISKKLSELGCFKNKGFYIRFPEFINKENLKHFIRGYLDGDGYISKNIKDPVVSFTSNSIFCKQLCDYLEKELNIHFCLSYYKKNTKVASIQTSGINQVIKLLDYLYEGSSLFMDRKYLLYKVIKDYKFEKDNRIKVIKKCSKCSNIHYAKNLCKSCYDKNRNKKVKSCQ